MKNYIKITTLFFLSVFLLTSCKEFRKSNSDDIVTKRTEEMMMEANRQMGMPGILNFQEKKNLKWIYELCDQEDFICHAYLFNSLEGKVGQYLGECIGYGIPYSTQYSNPQKLYETKYSGVAVTTIPQPEPNGLFKPEGLSATWLIMLDPDSGEPRPVYIEPSLIIFPYKLK